MHKRKFYCVFFLLLRKVFDLKISENQLNEHNFSKIVMPSSKISMTFASTLIHPVNVELHRSFEH